MTREESWFLRNRVSDEGSLYRWITGTHDEVQYRMPFQAHWLGITTCGSEGELGDTRPRLGCLAGEGDSFVGAAWQEKLDGTNLNRASAREKEGENCLRK